MAERVGSVRWSEMESTTLVASKSPVLAVAGPHMCRAVALLCSSSQPCAQSRGGAVPRGALRPALLRHAMRA
jgi:hypothetical protein